MSNFYVFSKNDDAAFERVVNFPPRGLGDKALGTIREGARSYNVSLFEAAETLLKNQELPTRTQKALTDFFIIIDKLKNIKVHWESIFYWQFSERI